MLKVEASVVYNLWAKKKKKKTVLEQIIFNARNANHKSSCGQDPLKKLV